MAIERVKGEHAQHQAESRARYDAEDIGCFGTIAMALALVVALIVCL